MSRAGRRAGSEGDSGIMSGQARARCEKGSVVSASRFRSVIGSDSVLTLNAREPPRIHSRAERGETGGGQRAGKDFRDGRCRSTAVLPTSLPSPRPLIDNIRSCMILVRVSQWPSGQARSTSIYVPGAPNYRRPESAVDNE